MHRPVSTVLLALTLLCLLIWIVGIRAGRRAVTATPGYRRNPEAMRRLSANSTRLMPLWRVLSRH